MTAVSDTPAGAAKTTEAAAGATESARESAREGVPSVGIYGVYRNLANTVQAATSSDRSPNLLTTENYQSILRSLFFLNDFPSIVSFTEFLFNKALFHMERSGDSAFQQCYLTYLNALLKMDKVGEAELLLTEFLKYYPENTQALRMICSIERYRGVGQPLNRLLDLEQKILKRDPGLPLIFLEMLDEAGQNGLAKVNAMRIKDSRFYPEICLASANLEDKPASKLAWFNEFLQTQGLLPVQLAEGREFGIDSLYCDDLPRVNLGPRVSILMTTFNSEHFVRTAVSSLLNQTYSNIELIIVDDASTDGTSGVLRQLEAQDDRVQIILKPHNEGTYPSKNLALRQATGVFVTCHDSDDWSHPQKIEREVEILLNDRTLLGASSSWVRTTSDGKFTLKSSGRYIHPNPAAFMFRREPVVERIGYFDAVRTGADTEFRRRIQLVFGTDRITHSETVFSLGRIHESSLTQYGPGAMNEFGSSQHRTAYTAEWLDWHFTAAENNTDVRIDIDEEARPFWAPPEIVPDQQRTGRPVHSAGKSVRLGPLRSSQVDVAFFIDPTKPSRALTHLVWEVELLLKEGLSVAIITRSGVQAGQAPPWQYLALRKLRRLIWHGFTRRFDCKLLVLDAMDDGAAGPAALKSAEKVVAVGAGSDVPHDVPSYARADRILGADVSAHSWPVVLPMRKPVRAENKAVTAGVWLLGGPEYQAKAHAIAQRLLAQGFELAVMGNSAEGLGERVQFVKFDPYGDNYLRFAQVCDIACVPLLDHRQLATDAAVARLLAYDTPVVLVRPDAANQQAHYAPCMVIEPDALETELKELLSADRLEAWRADIRNYMAERFSASVYLERLSALLSKADAP